MKRALYRMAPAPESRAFYVLEGSVGLACIIAISIAAMIAVHVATVQCASCGGL